jgi:radical SAM protein with 4Fe4S-binding SPASM domain
MTPRIGPPRGALDEATVESTEWSRAIGPEANRPDHGPEAIPHVVAWNLTRRCNLACAHCYISAGSWQAADDELSTAECRRIVDEVVEASPAPMLILSGGEPLVRGDLEEISAYATEQGATVVIGTNGTHLTDDRIASLTDGGVQGFAVSIDSLDGRYHDRFRHGQGALADTLAATGRLRSREVDFIVQTTVTRGNREEIEEIGAWAAERCAVAFNVYFIVATGRAEGMRGLSPAENDDVLSLLVALEEEYRGQMMVRAKCQPQIMRHAYESDHDSPLLNYATRCPCGVQYCRITPEGKVTPCPYSTVVAGDLRSQSFGEVWRESTVFRQLREGRLAGKCGRCRYRVICGGCRARAHAESGDLLAADESCVYEPRGEETPIRPTRSVTYGAAPTSTMEWTSEALARMDRIPGFVRGVVAARVEEYASEKGYERITPDVLAAVRGEMGVDFSKRKPFFLNRN